MGFRTKQRGSVSLQYLRWIMQAGFQHFRNVFFENHISLFFVLADLLQFIFRDITRNHIQELPKDAFTNYSWLEFL